MKPIYCPNCGSKMIVIERGNQPTIAWMACALDGGCGVRGPLAERRTGTAAVRLAARLTREWIARMEAITRDGITGDIVTLDDPTVKALRREGMIKALRWSLEKDYVDRFAAITRLENGGDL